jgi:hypothetical protein
VYHTSKPNTCTRGGLSLKQGSAWWHIEHTGGGLVKPETKRQKVLQVEIWAGGNLGLLLEIPNLNHHGSTVAFHFAKCQILESIVAKNLVQKTEKPVHVCASWEGDEIRARGLTQHLLHAVTRLHETLLKRVIRQMPFLCIVRYIYPRNIPPPLATPSSEWTRLPARVPGGGSTRQRCHSD